MRFLHLSLLALVLTSGLALADKHNHHKDHDHDHAHELDHDSETAEKNEIAKSDEIDVALLPKEHRSLDEGIELIDETTAPKAPKKV